ncbi:hypothetical protein [uncultured Rothia sp.]|uniref:hypothetical protein n=1 Tax=uncultured Rothia sp. TaxID=316088 RepID=UPI0032180642
MTATETVSSTIRALMGAEKKTIAEFALKLGVTRQTASLFYNGHRAMSTDQIAITAQWLDVSPGALFAGISYERLAA